MEAALQRCESCGQMILEKGIPLPPKKKGKWNFLNDMRIGDSIICTTIKDFEDISKRATRNWLENLAY